MGEYSFSGSWIIDDLPQPLPSGVSGGAWMEIIQFAYGAPFAGSPVWRVMTTDGKSIGVRHADGEYVWKQPLVLGEKWNYGAGIKLSKSSARGWFWFGAWRDTDLPWKYLVPATSMATMIPSMDVGPFQMRLDAYTDAKIKTAVRFTPPRITRDN